MSNARSIVVLVAAIVLGFGLALLFAGVSGSLVAESQVNVNASADGEKIFLDRCSSCHAIDIAAASGFGPNIANIGHEAASRKSGLNAAEFILESVLKPEAHRQPGASGHMPRGIASGLNPEQVRSLITYTAALGNDPNLEEVARLEINPRSLEVEQRNGASLALLKRGESLFFKELGCSSCHSIYGEPGSSLAAPALDHASTLAPAYIAESIREPNAVIAAGYRQISLETNKGERVQGRLVRESSATLSVLSHISGDRPRLRIISRNIIAKLNESSISSMPPYNLSDKDEAALVAFLGFLEAETTEP